MARQSNSPFPDASAFGAAGRGGPRIGDPQPRPAAPARIKHPWLWHLRLRTKVVAVAVVPAIVAVALAGISLNSQLSNAGTFDRAVSGVDLTRKTAALANELGRERDLMTALVAANRTRDRGPIQQEKSKVDDAVAQFRADQSQVNGQLKPVQDAYTRAVDRLDSIAPLRSVAEGSQYPTDAVFNSYSSIIDTMLQLQREIAAGTTGDNTLIAKSRAAEALARSHEQIGQERSLVLAAILRGSLTSSQIDDIQAAGAKHDAATTDFQNVADSVDTTAYSDTVAGPEVDGRERLRQIVLAHGQTNAPLNVNPDEWDHDSGVTMDLVDQVENRVLDEVAAQAQASGEQARASAVWNSVPVLLALIIAVILGLMVARSILRQLRVLRRSALEVADTRLPAAVQRILADPNPLDAYQNAIPPVPIQTTEEIGQLARSFDMVHDQAVRLAAEQAVLRDNVNSMFVNLSRRSQTLVERQLSLIDRLEQDEQDPDQLSNLFELDHLATRMRRNSENLLVLSGSGFGKRLNRPVAVGELIGAAVSEVEQYARIEVAPPPDIAVQGWVVNDLIHLVAELLDNATSFSEPQTKVSVRIAKTRQQELAIQIADRGVGMSEKDIADSNARLADPPDIDVAVSRRMGLFVVARLAKRHNIRVRLHPSEDIEGGTRATIAVPPDLVTSLNQDPPRANQTAAFTAVSPMTSNEISSPSAMLSPFTASQPGFEDSSYPGGYAAANGAHNGLDGSHDLAHGGQHDADGQADGDDDSDHSHSMRELTELITPLTPVSGSEADEPQHEDAWSHQQETAEFGAAAHSADPADQLDDDAGSANPEERPAERSGERPFVPQVSFVHGTDGEQAPSEVPPWVGTDSEDLRNLVAAWQRQGMQEQEEIQAERSGRFPAVPKATTKDTTANGKGAAASSSMSDFEAEDQAGPAYAEVAGHSLGAGAPEGHRDLDAPTERLPIYEAVLSQWFQADEADEDEDLDVEETPISASALAAEPKPETSRHELTQHDLLRHEPAPADDAERDAAGDPGQSASAGLLSGTGSSGESLSGFASSRAMSAAAGDREAEAESATGPDPAGEPAGGLAAAGGLPKRQPGARTWQTPADEGWNAAQSLLNTPAEDVTKAGLPKRVPRAHLVPGSAQPRQSQQAQPPNLPGLTTMPPRSADSTRTRMSSFQKGIRRGRHARVDALAERLSQDSPNAGESGHDEGRS